MPIYEYICQSCGQHKEVLQKISDEPLTVCDACGQSALKKMISSTSFRLKGGGWYETDFKSNNKDKKTAKSSDASSVKNDTVKSSTKETKSSSSTDSNSSSSATNGD